MKPHSQLLTLVPVTALETLVLVADTDLFINSSQPLPYLNIFGLPLVKRLALTARKGGIKRLIVLTPETEVEKIKILLADERVAELRVEIIGVAEQIPLQSTQALQMLKLKDAFIFVTGEAIFDFRLLQALNSSWVDSGQSLLNNTAGILVCAPEILPNLYAYRDEAVFSAAKRLLLDGQITEFPLQHYFAQSLKTAADLMQAKNALYRGHGKESDGIYANFNKRVVARPLMNLLFHTAITPNMVTLTGLLFGFLSGTVFAFGGYWYTLAGALLYYVSSILDHCDGMLARLKFQESAFGCWLESVSDYTSYVAVFAGMGIGLYRSTGSITYAYIGGAFIFGCIFSFIATSYQRKKFSGDKPQDYINRWHKQVESHMGNPIFYFSRKAYFLARRATLPYAILIFTVFDITWLFIYLCAFGANLYWILTLNSNRIFKKNSST